MKKLNVLDIIALILVIVGGLSWGMVGLFRFNLVAVIFSAVPVLARIVYTIVGVAAVYVAIIFARLGRK